MKKTLLWLAGGVVSILIVLAVIGYFAGPAPAKISEPVPIDRRTQLNQTLASHDLTICEVYNWIGTMEAQTRKELEASEPNMNVLKRDDRLEQIRDEKWKQYRTTHQIPDSLRVLVNGYGLQECN